MFCRQFPRTSCCASIWRWSEDACGTSKTPRAIGSGLRVQSKETPLESLVEMRMVGSRTHFLPTLSHHCHGCDATRSGPARLWCGSCSAAKASKAYIPTVRDLYQRVLSGLDCSNPVLRCSLVEKAAVPVKLPQPRFFATNTPMPEPEVADCQSGP